MKRRSKVLLLALLIVGGGIAWSALKPPNPTLVRTSKVEQVDQLRSLVSATGEVRAKEFVDIQAEVPGIIVDLPVHEGDRVQKGDVLLKLDDLQLKAEEDSARAQVGSAQADAENAKVGVATAEANLAAQRTALANLRIESEQAKISCERAQASLARKKELFDSQLLGGEDFEIAAADTRLAERRLQWNEARISQGEADVRAMETRVDAAKAQVEGARRRVDAANASLARATDQVGKTVLRAPLSGLITKLQVEKGERAVPGIQSNPIATLMTIADMSIVEAEIQVAEADIVAVRLGAPATVEVDALRDVRIKGTVTEIGHSPIQPSSSQQGGQSQNQEGKDFKVVVRLVDPPESLRPGFTAQAEIETAVREHCLVMPLQALTAREIELDPAGRYVPPPEVEPTGAVAAASSRQRDKQERDGVFVLQDGRARFRLVKTGITGDMDIEVLEGLAAGDEVVSGPYQVLRTLKEWDRIAVDSKHQGDESTRLRRKKR